MALPGPLATRFHPLFLADDIVIQNSTYLGLITLGAACVQDNLAVSEPLPAF